jgi:spore maturation protein CgeB
MKILYVAPKYDWGKPERGYVDIHYMFYETLRHLGHEVVYFDFMTIAQERGGDAMNRHLLEVVTNNQPALMFTVLAYDNQLNPSVVRRISETSETLTMNWFCDDHYRFDNYSRYWAPCFNWVVTTDEESLPKYAQLGHKNVILSQWACNPFVYRKLALPKLYDVTFVGARFGSRIGYIEALQKAGIAVEVWGSGWDSSRLSHDELIAVFNQSRINLNFTASSCPLPADNRNGQVWLARRCMSRLLNVLPFGQSIKETGKHWLKSALGNGSFLGQPQVTPEIFPKQIKGRNFEIPGCGGFLLTEEVIHLEKYYEVDKEVGCFRDTDELIDKVCYYLRHQDEVDTIAQAGYERTLKAHTYVHRLTEVFQKMGLPA